jgi:hypothetical protein
MSDKSSLKGFPAHIAFPMAEILRDNIIVIIPNEKLDLAKDKKYRRSSSMRMMHYPEDMFMTFISSFGTSITISRDEITSDELVKLEKDLVKLENEVKNLNDKVYSFDTKISKVKSQKDIIKANIVEQALGETKEGMKMLKSLQEIDFGVDIKVITTKK